MGQASTEHYWILCAILSVCTFVRTADLQQHCRTVLTHGTTCLIAVAAAEMANDQRC
jgi:hypothetical protein